jgi:hypothetical protein
MHAGQVAALGVRGPRPADQVSDDRIVETRAGPAGQLGLEEGRRPEAREQPRLPDGQDRRRRSHFDSDPGGFPARIPAPIASSSRRSKSSSQATGRGGAPAPPRLRLELAGKLDGLPKDLGVILVGLGAVGIAIAIPGPIPPGASFFLLGVVFLWPGLLARLGGWFAGKFPRIIRLLISLVDHFRTDLERRDPGTVGG